MAVAVGCHKDPQVTTRVVTAYVPQACAAPADAFVSYDALGDYEGSAAPSGHRLSDVGAQLVEITTQARALDVEAVQGELQWGALGPVPPSGDVDVLLLPELAPCTLSDPMVGMPIESRTDPVLAAFGDRRVMIAGNYGTSGTVVTYVARLDTGVVAPVGGDLTTPRTDATATAFGDGVLVAGGTLPGEPTVPSGDAEVYDPATDSFRTAKPITLDQPRARHGAAVLATGETLLVGGVGADAKTPLRSMVVVDPVTHAARPENVAFLKVARIAPTVLVLANGEVLIAGGTDASGAAVPTLEWFSPDASMPFQTVDLVAGVARSYVALEAGGALAVIAPPMNAPKNFQDVWLIGPGHDPEPAAPLGGSLTAPALFGGAGGAPLLWTGDRWLRWQPWAGAFGPVQVAAMPMTNIGPATSSPDPGLAAWLGPDTTTLTLLRFDVHGAYSTLQPALLVADTTSMAPDRLPSPTTLSFDATQGLVMQDGASAFVTDRTYADVTLDLDAPTGEPAEIVLRDERGVELVVGSTQCPLALPLGVPSTTHVERRGANVSWSTGAGTFPCATGVRADARLSIGVRSVLGGARAVDRNLRIARLGTP
jgi:hypothetical protein